MASENQKDKSRQIKESVIKLLFARSGNECAHPECTRNLIASDNKTIVGKICHIVAASKKGPRYDDLLSDEDRRSFDNLILLCDEHHSIIDNKTNESSYPVELLKTWKNNHEKKILDLVSSKNLLSKHPLALNKVINCIGNKMEEILDLPETINPPNPDTKISFNNVIRYESIIKEFAPYQGKLNKIYEEIEKEGSIKKELVLHNIKRLYLIIKTDYPNMDSIRKNADKIFDKVIDKIWENIDKAPNKLDELDQETIDFSLMIIVVDAFMRCNILEEPPKAI